MKVIFCLVALLFCPSFATLGVDVSVSVDTNTWNCLSQNNIQFAIVRCFRSNGNTDPNCPTTIANAQAAGIQYVDAYIFPCYSCGGPEDQISTLVSFLQSNNVQYQNIWFDIEGPQYWSSNPQDNINFISAMAQQAKSLGQNVGVYTSNSQWTPITGGWTGLSTYSLWYAHYDNNPSFDDFNPFGGWNNPVMKQYQGDATLCSVDLDLDYYP